MRSSRYSRPLQKTQISWNLADSFAPYSFSRRCSARSSSSSKHLPNLWHQRGKTGKSEVKEPDPTDHRSIGARHSLFTTDLSSPGTPFFLPDGTHIFQKLTSFLRAQYPAFGFREVLTPTIYKEELWRQSGHWDNYKDDMFTVERGQRQAKTAALAIFRGGRLQTPTETHDSNVTETYGLKPMNCPGHCILFRSKRRSYKELPIRYAEFSPLHRNEISGALSGLTRVRRFHQDDGHIFCRPSQVMGEVLKSIQFIKLVYQALHFNISDLSFVLSTRPKEGYIGEVEEWDMAEAQLKEALDQALNHDKSVAHGDERWTVSEDGELKDALDQTLDHDKSVAHGDEPWTVSEGHGELKEALDQVLDHDKSVAHGDELWTVSEGDGAFYGPKIDVILRDSDGKQHQTATIQLDFQLPKRFQLEYEAPAPDLEAKGVITDDPVLMETMGRVTPVMIHRAVLGSLERFIALLLENDRGKLPIWLSPRQMIILTVTDNPRVVKAAQLARDILSDLIPEDMAGPRPLNKPTYIVDLDASGDSIRQKVARAKKGKHNLICVMGMKNLKATKREKKPGKATMDVEVNRDMQPDLVKTWDRIEKIKPGSQAPQQKDRGVGGVSGGNGVRLEVGEVKKLMARLCDDYL